MNCDPHWWYVPVMGLAYVFVWVMGYLSGSDDR
jgi:hypothetical protein